MIPTVTYQDAIAARQSTLDQIDRTITEITDRTTGLLTPDQTASLSAAMVRLRCMRVETHLPQDISTQNENLRKRITALRTNRLPQKPGALDLSSLLSRSSSSSLLSRSSSSSTPPIPIPSLTHSSANTTAVPSYTAPMHSFSSTTIETHSISLPVGPATTQHSLLPTPQTAKDAAQQRSNADPSSYYVELTGNSFSHSHSVSPSFTSTSQANPKVNQRDTKHTVVPKSSSHLALFPPNPLEGKPLDQRRRLLPPSIFSSSSSLSVSITPAIIGPMNTSSSTSSSSSRSSSVPQGGSYSNLSRRTGENNNNATGAVDVRLLSTTIAPNLRTTIAPNQQGSFRDAELQKRLANLNEKAASLNAKKVDLLVQQKRQELTPSNSHLSTVATVAVPVALSSSSAPSSSTSTATTVAVPTEPNSSSAPSTTTIAAPAPATQNSSSALSSTSTVAVVPTVQSPSTESASSSAPAKQEG